jgi:hypothetical protein
VAVDATCCRVMGLRPEEVKYIAQAATLLGHIQTEQIQQLGESIANCRTPFAVLEEFTNLRDQGTGPKSAYGFRRSV